MSNAERELLLILARRERAILDARRADAIMAARDAQDPDVAQRFEDVEAQAIEDIDELDALVEQIEG